MSTYIILPLKVDYDIAQLKYFIKRNGGIKKQDAGMNQNIRPYWYN